MKLKEFDELPVGTVLYDKCIDTFEVKIAPRSILQLCDWYNKTGTIVRRFSAEYVSTIHIARDDMQVLR